MEAVTPESLPYGLIAKRRATLSMTTILFGEASRLFAMSRPDTPYEELQRLVVEENALLKRTESSRRRVFRALREFYGLRQPIPVYRIARELWEEAPAEQPLVAMLCCLAREPLLRSTAAVVLPKPAGAPVRTDELDPAIEKSFPGRYRENVRARMARHAASSWQQSGHLAGKQRKTRGTALSGPATTAHALLLGHLCGVRGKQLFDTLWVQTLDCSTARGHEYREEYFQNPDDLALALDDFADHLDVKVRESAVADANTVVALLGVGSLFGVGSVSRLVQGIADAVPGRLRVFFPGEREGSNYRLLDAKDGWNYLSTPIAAPVG